MNKNNWLYIEPYTYIELQKNNVLLYNTLNGEFLRSDSPLIIKLFERLVNKSNSYTIKLKKNDLVNYEISSFIEKLRYLFMGDCIQTKTVVIKKELTISDFLNKIKRAYIPLKEISNLKSFLKEITIVVNNSNTNNNVNKIYFQYNSKPGRFQNYKEMKIENLDLIIQNINSSPIDCINIIGNNVFIYSKFYELVQKLNDIDSVKIYYTYYDDIIKLIDEKGRNYIIDLFKYLEKRFSIVNVFVDSFIESNMLKKIIDIKETVDLSCEFQFIIEKEEDIYIAEKFSAAFKDEDFSLYPLYNGKNIDFFKENVFLTETDITNIPALSDKDLFVNSTINKDNFGKLIFMNNGDIYSNIHLPKLGRLNKNKLYEIIYKELKEGNWLRTRKKINPCKKCVYNTFCPPVTNYEFALGRNNLCHILS